MYRRSRGAASHKLTASATCLLCPYRANVALLTSPPAPIVSHNATPAGTHTVDCPLPVLAASRVAQRWRGGRAPAAWTATCRAQGCLHQGRTRTLGGETRGTLAALSAAAVARHRRMVTGAAETETAAPQSGATTVNRRHTGARATVMAQFGKAMASTRARATRHYGAEVNAQATCCTCSST